MNTPDGPYRPSRALTVHVSSSRRLDDVTAMQYSVSMTTRSVLLRMPDNSELYQALRRIAFDRDISIPKVVTSIVTDALRDTGVLSTPDIPELEGMER